MNFLLFHLLSALTSRGAKRLFILGLVLLPLLSPAQTTVFDATGTTPLPTNWTSADNVPNMAVVQPGYYLLEAGSPADVITTATYDLSTYSAATLTLKVATFGGGAGAANKATVAISTDGGTTYAQTALSATPTSATVYDATTSVALTSLSSQVRVRITNAGSAGQGVRLQDIKLIASPVPTSFPAGALLLEDNFDYPVGTPVAASAATGWLDQATGGATALVTTAAGNLAREGYPRGVMSATPAGPSSQVGLVGGVGAQDVYRSFGGVAGGQVLYAAALVNVAAAQLGGEYFLSLYNSTKIPTTYRGRVYVRATLTGGLNFGLSTDGVLPVYSPAVYAPNTTYLVVLKYERSAATGNLDAASLFVVDNTPALVPVAEFGPPTVGPLPTALGSELAGLNAVLLRQATLDYPTLALDNLRVATGWGAAVGRPVFTNASGALSPGNYYSLEVTGTGAVATPQGAVMLENTLNLDGGQVATSSTNSLTLRGAVTCQIGSGGTGFVDGPLRRESSEAGTLFFPIGRNNAANQTSNYRPLTLNVALAPAGTTTYAALQTEGPSDDQVLIDPIKRISKVRYFSLTPSPVPAAGAFKGTVQLSFGPDDAVNQPGLASFVVAKSDGRGWSNLDRVANGSDNLSSGSFTDFSDFILASKDIRDYINPLPVQLVSFGAARGAPGRGAALGHGLGAEQRPLRGGALGRRAQLRAGGHGGGGRHQRPAAELRHPRRRGPGRRPLLPPAASGPRRRGLLLAHGCRGGGRGWARPRRGRAEPEPQPGPRRAHPAPRRAGAARPARPAARPHRPDGAHGHRAGQRRAAARRAARRRVRAARGWPLPPRGEGVKLFQPLRLGPPKKPAALTRQRAFLRPAPGARPGVLQLGNLSIISRLAFKRYFCGSILNVIKSRWNK